MSHPDLPEPRVPHVHGRDLVPLRVHARRFPDARQQHLFAREDAARARIAELDKQLVDLSIERKALMAEIHAVHDQLRPCYGRARGRRRRAVTDEEPLPPADEQAEWLSGRELRAICLSFLKRAGRALTLRQIHCLLHRAGYAVAHYHPVKALADALGHEADAGRVSRVRRATYATPGVPPDDDLEPALPDR